MSTNPTSLLLGNPKKRPSVLPGFEQPTVQPRPNIQPTVGAINPNELIAPTLADFRAGAGKGGKVESVFGQKKKPGAAFADFLATQGPQEAREFQFDLPEAQFGTAVQGLLGTAGAAGQAAGQAGQDRQAALGELAELQQRALSPNLDPETRAFFQQQADDRRADILTRFGEGGDIGNVFERQGASTLANLASRGVLDTTTGSQALARRDFDLAALANTLLGQAAEQSRQDVLGERTGIRDVATQFGGLQGQQAIAAGQLQNALLGTQAGAFQGAGGLDIQGREQLAGQQLAGAGQRLLGSQTALQNLQSLRNQRLQRSQAKERFALEQQLLQDQINQSGFLPQLLSGLGTAGLAAATGGLGGFGLQAGLQGANKIFGDLLPDPSKVGGIRN